MKFFPLKPEGNIVKRDILLSALIGIYFLLVLFSHDSIINFILNRFGIKFHNQHFYLTAFSLYLISSVTAGFLSYKLNKIKQLSFDRKLINALTGALTFILALMLPIILTNSDISVFGFIGILFFSILFSFIIAALSATLLSRILTKQPQ